MLKIQFTVTINIISFAIQQMQQKWQHVKNLAILTKYCKIKKNCKIWQTWQLWQMCIAYITKQLYGKTWQLNHYKQP